MVDARAFCINGWGRYAMNAKNNFTYFEKKLGFFIILSNFDDNAVKKTVPFVAEIKGKMRYLLDIPSERCYNESCYDCILYSIRLYII